MFESFPGVAPSNPPGPVLAHPIQIKFEGAERAEWYGPHEVGPRVEYRVKPKTRTVLVALNHVITLVPIVELALQGLVGRPLARVLR